MGSRVTSGFGVAMWVGFALLTATYVHASSSADKLEERAFGFGPPGSNSGGGNSGGNPFGGNGFGGFNGFAGFDIQEAMRYRSIHGILASLAIVVIFPIGAILMRLVPGRAAVWIHALTQMIGFVIFVAAAGIGIHLVRTVRLPFNNGGSLLDNPATKMHPIMGLVTLSTLALQPFLGWMHHRQFRKLGRRTFWSHMHLWNGRFGITGGMVTGLLGLQLAGAPQHLKVAYIAVAAVMWVLWATCAIVGEVRRRRKGPAGANPAPAAGGGGRRGSRASGRARVVAPKPSMTSQESDARPSRGSRGSTRSGEGHRA